MREGSRTAFRSEAARSLGRRELLLAGGGLWAGYGAEGAEGPPEIIDLAGAKFTEITAINDRREVAGYAFVDGRNVSFVGGAGRAAREMVAMPRFLQHTAFGLNNRGDLVGMGVLFLEQQPVRMAFIRRGQEAEPLRMGDSRATAAFGINDRGDVVGIYGESEAGIRSFLLPAGALRPQPLEVPGASRTRAHDINNAGVVVGEYTEGGVTRGFLHRAGKTERFEVEGATSTHPYGINARGDVVGYTKTGSTVRGFVRSAAGVVTAFAIPGCEETKLAAINGRGDLAGTIYRREAGHVQGFVLLAEAGKPAR